jgi:hypothetical protein
MNGEGVGGVNMIDLLHTHALKNMKLKLFKK